MDLCRKILDKAYYFLKPIIFASTNKDPEIAHELFTDISKFLNLSCLDKILFKSNTDKSFIEISNAAGFNKDAKIPIKTLEYIGFDRAVIGTVTNLSWKGNFRPRIKRDVLDESLYNYVGWQNEGSKKISNRLKKHEINIPITINIGPTPDPYFSLKKRLEDIRKTVINFRDLDNVDKFEYNPTCPNINISRKENLENLPYYLNVILENAKHKKVSLKISPDINDEEVKQILKITKEYPLSEYVISNTTKNFPKGSWSGNRVYEDSLRVQRIFERELERLERHELIIACGGIDSIEKLKERTKNKRVKGIQIFTPLIFRGTELISELRNHKQ